MVGRRESPAESTIRVTIEDLKQEVLQKEAQLETLTEKELLEQKIKQMIAPRQLLDTFGVTAAVSIRMKLKKLL